MFKARTHKFVAIAALLVSVGVAACALGSAHAADEVSAVTLTVVETSTDNLDTWSAVSSTSGSVEGIAFRSADVTNEWFGVIVDRYESTEVAYRVDRTNLSSTQIGVFETYSNEKVTMTWDASGVTGVSAQ